MKKSRRSGGSVLSELKAKAMAAAKYAPVAKKYGKMAAKFLGKKVLGPVGDALTKAGSGRRFKKGSPEAKAFMAKLRGMRRK